MEYDEECMRILYAAELPTRLNEERLIFELTDFHFTPALHWIQRAFRVKCCEVRSAIPIFTTKLRLVRKFKPMPTWVTSTASHRISRRKTG